MGLLDMFGTSMDDPRTAATLQLAQGLLSSPRVMQGLAGGLSGYQQAMAQAKQQKALEEMRAMQLQQMQMQMADQRLKSEALQREQAKEQGIENAYRNAFRTPEQMAMAQNGGPTVAAAQAAPTMQAGFDQGALRNELAKVDPLTAYKLFQPKAREIKEYREVRNPDGSVTIAGFDKEGNMIDTKAAPFKAAEVRDFGGYVGGVDPISGTVKRLGDKTQSPDSRASNALGWANHSLSQQRLNFDRQNGGEAKAPQGYRWKPDGTLEPIKGGPADRQATASEGERKAATLLARLEGSMGQLSDVVGKNADAAKPGVWASMAGGVPLVGEAFRNSVNSSDRQRVEAAQLDMLDAALTLGTGAAYTREQLEGYRRSYFPQIGDSADTVKDKQARLETVIRAARISAGRAAQSADGAAGVKPPSTGAPVLRWNEQTMSFEASTNAPNR